MLSDLELCDAVAASYATPPTLQALDVRIVISRCPGGLTVLALPGTRPDHVEDWRRDLEIDPGESRVHPELGECHDGVLVGAEAMFNQFLMQAVQGPYVVAGHSLGGGLAVLLSAMAAYAGSAPQRLVTFGCMRASIGRRVPGILKDVPGAHYRNGGDPVPMLPTWPYEEWRERAQLGQGFPIRVEDHAIAAYRSSVAGAAAASSTSVSM